MCIVLIWITSYKKLSQIYIERGATFMVLHTHFPETKPSINVDEITYSWLWLFPPDVLYKIWMRLQNIKELQIQEMREFSATAQLWRNQELRLQKQVKRVLFLGQLKILMQRETNTTKQLLWSLLFIDIILL